VDLALGDSEVDTPERNEIAEALGDPAHLQER